MCQFCEFLLGRLAKLFLARALTGYRIVKPRAYKSDNQTG
jgi:hypothetical protein